MIDALNILPPSPFISDPENRFVLDVEAFMVEVEGMPAFLESPSPEYLKAAELMPIVKLLGSHIQR